MPFRKPDPIRKEIQTRNLKNLDNDLFEQDILLSSLTTDPLDDITDLVDLYNSTLTDILDSHAPVQTKTITVKHQSPWFTEEIHKAKQLRRRAERQWRKTKLAVHLEIYRTECRNVSRLCNEARKCYYCLQIEECGHDQKKIFSIANDLMNKKKDCSLPTSSDPKELSEQFAEFFTDKIEKIKQTFDDTIVDNAPEGVPPPPILDMLSPTNADELRKIITSGNSKSCALDPLPTHLLKSSINVLLPVLTKIVNCSLQSATVPQSLKAATVKPLLKKSTLSKEDLKNYRPVSNLPYLSKLIEKIVVKRLNTHMSQHRLHEYFQSAYRLYHSTETALLRVHNDILQSLDDKKCVFLVLLDQSAAFDTVKHSILLDRVRETVGVQGVALDWLLSYFAERTQSVSVLGVSSVPRPLPSGMPQGSVVGPFGFPMYTTPVGRICQKHGIKYHFYADDSQLYLAFDPDEEHIARGRLEACIAEIRDWMKSNHLKLNDTKTEFLVIGSPTHLRQLSKDGIKIGESIIPPAIAARNIGATFDNSLTMKQHVNAMCRAGYCHIKNIGRVRGSLTQDASVNLIHAFVTSRLDQMNALLYGVPQYLIQKLQKIQNNAARIVLRAKRREHITPILQQLHWLPVAKRIEFKVLLMTFKSLTGLAPGYIADLLEPYTPPRALRSLDLSLLKMPRSRTKSYGDRSFRVCAPYLWNKLPHDIRRATELDGFKDALKHHLFKQAFDLQ